jgi:hypothetical protein
MPIPNEFNKFGIHLYEYTNDKHYKNRRTFTSKFSDVCDIINHEKGDILEIKYDFDYIYGTSLYINYLASSVDKYNKPYIANRKIIVETADYIRECDFIHEMYVNERFLKYFKVCLKHNEPEIIVSREVL